MNLPEGKKRFRSEESEVTQQKLAFKGLSRDNRSSEQVAENVGRHLW